MFSKVPESVISCGSAVIIDPEVSQAVDCEAELAVIIGKGAHRIHAKDAFDHVWGYTIINDVTARDLQGRYSQWLIGKSQDTFCPMGPYAVTREDIDIGNTPISCHVNAELRQSSNTRLLIFDIPTIIETLSAGYHAAARRRDRNRHTSGRRHRLQSAAIPLERRRRAYRNRWHRGARE